MLRRNRLFLLALAGFSMLVLSSLSFAFSLGDCTLSNSEAEDSQIEHLFGGAPDDSEIHERRAYVLAYNEQHRVPRWAAWHAEIGFRDTPKRKTRWSSFRTDPEIPQVKDKDYVGWYDSEENFARGHLVPFFISGGDRDDDGEDAELESNLRAEDEYDACTVYEIYALSNIAPQYHTRFNGSPGAWWQLETDLRALVDDGHEYFNCR